MAPINRQITLVSRPVGYPKVSDFHLVYAPLPSPRAGEVLVRSVYLSLDPWMRERMNGGESDARPVALGEVMCGGAVGVVVGSRDPGRRIGDAVVGILGWQEYAVASASALREVDRDLAPISTALGVLGMPGLTAYFGLLDLCDPQRGENVVVSGAAGAVGMIAGQIAKIRGCRVVGVAGSGVKLDWLLDELGLDAALSYESAGELQAALGELCPDGFDVYFDCVGGAVTDSVLRRINTGARIAVYGQSSQYNLEEAELGPRWLGQLIVKQAMVQGFLVSSYAPRFPEGFEQLARWLKEGKLKYREQVAQGIEAAPQAFIAMLQERNEGMQLVQLSEW
ncbi:MAG TPA: NADP-dependent oxidoreductase [Thermoanaerobaculia bacterium]|nr:NADP-dependent oxidoreductase [Thermoanaerobaculia bacterium]